MALCPVCQAEQVIESHHHGTLYTCSACNAVFFVNWDGLPEVADHEPIEGEGFVGESDIPENISSMAENPPLEYSPEFEANHESEMEPQAQDIEVNFGGNEPDYMATGLPEETPIEEPLNPTEAPVMTLQGLTEELDHFANAETPLDGFSYTLRIKNLDSKEARQMLEEILLDPRLGFDVADLLENIHDGQLSLLNMNAAKSFVIVDKCQQCLIEIEWSQNV